MEENKKTREEPQNESMKSLPAWSWGILIGLCILSVVILFIVFKPHKNGYSQVVDIKTKTVNTEYHWVVEDRIPVSFTGEYGETVYISKGRGFSFENSPEPYCAENLAGSESCGQKGEDISSKLPKDSNYNTGLKFKSSNGKSGQLIVVVWISVKK